jgi:hypothetical protein
MGGTHGMKYNIKLIEGSNRCEDCGVYAWYTLSLTREDGTVEIISDGDDHLGGMDFYNPWEVAQGIVKTLQMLGHTVYYIHEEVPMSEYNTYDDFDDIDDNLYDERDND